MQKIIHTNYKKGFTLIELLVVIAIIGILSSIILVSLNTARQKGMDGAVKGDLSTIRVQAALDRSGNNNSYGTMSAVVSGSPAYAWTGTPGAAPLFVAAGINTGDKTVGNALTNAYANASGPNRVYYYANDNAFFAAARLSGSQGYWCVDANGYGGIIATAPATTATACN